MLVFLNKNACYNKPLATRAFLKLRNDLCSLQNRANHLFHSVSARSLGGLLLSRRMQSINSAMTSSCLRANPPSTISETFFFSWLVRELLMFSSIAGLFNKISWRNCFHDV